MHDPAKVCMHGCHIMHQCQLLLQIVIIHAYLTNRKGDPIAASNDPSLRLDLGIRGVWQPQVEALLDIRVIDTDAPSYIGDAHPPLCLIVGPLRRKGCIALLLRTGEEIYTFCPVC